MDNFMDDFKKYLEMNNGISILSTIDDKGEINSAIYSKPNFFENREIAFIMTRKASYKNVKENLNASFVFINHSIKKDSVKGLGFKLRKLKEIKDISLIKTMIRRSGVDKNSIKDGSLVLVIFKIIESKFF